MAGEGGGVEVKVRAEPVQARGRSGRGSGREPRRGIFRT